MRASCRVVGIKSILFFPFHYGLNLGSKALFSSFSFFFFFSIQPIVEPANDPLFSASTPKTRPPLFSFPSPPSGLVARWNNQFSTDRLLFSFPPGLMQDAFLFFRMKKGLIPPFSFLEKARSAASPPPPPPPQSLLRGWRLTPPLFLFLENFLKSSCARTVSLLSLPQA